MKKRMAWIKINEMIHKVEFYLKDEGLEQELKKVCEKFKKDFPDCTIEILKTIEIDE